MGTKTYQCIRCKTKFDVTGNAVMVSCPSCLSTKTRRVWKPSAIHYKVGGFYSTDNKK